MEATVVTGPDVVTRDPCGPWVEIPSDWEVTGRPDSICGMTGKEPAILLSSGGSQGAVRPPDITAGGKTVDGDGTVGTDPSTAVVGTTDPVAAVVLLVIPPDEPWVIPAVLTAVTTVSLTFWHFPSPWGAVLVVVTLTTEKFSPAPDTKGTAGAVPFLLLRPFLVFLDLAWSVEELAPLLVLRGLL